MSIEISLKGKTAAVTGGGRGIGKAIAMTLAQAGAKVWIGNRTEEQSVKTVNEMKELGYEAGYTNMDVASYDDMKRFLDDAEKFGDGKLDIVVNAAGIVDTDSFLDLKVDQFKKLLDVNVIGVSNAAQVAIEKMKPHNEGRIVIVASIAGREGLEILPHYCSTKAAAISLTQSAAKVAAHHHINVNAVAPGIIRTKMWEEILDGLVPEGADRDEAFDGFIDNMIPLKKAQTEEDIADTVLFLCSDLASEITGQTINIDGGAVMS